MREVVAVVLHFRSADMSSRCLASLREHGLSSVVLVDNSEDGRVSLQLVERAADDIGLSLDVVEPGHNIGFARGVNAGLEAVRSRHPGHDVLLINNDACLAPGTLEHLRLAVEGSRPCVAAPSIDGPTGHVSARTFYRHITGAITPSGPGWRGHAVLGGACLLLHASLAEQPLFDEAFFFYGDDIELGYRLAQRSIALIDVPSGTVIHQGSASSRNGSLFYEYHMNRAHLLLISRLGYRFPVSWMLYPLRIVLLGCRATIRLFRFRALSSWKGLILACADVARGRVRSLTPPPRSETMSGSARRA